MRPERVCPRRRHPKAAPLDVEYGVPETPKPDPSKRYGLPGETQDPGKRGTEGNYHDAREKPVYSDDIEREAHLDTRQELVSAWESRALVA